MAVKYPLAMANEILSDQNRILEQNEIPANDLQAVRMAKNIVELKIAYWQEVFKVLDNQPI